MKNGVQYLSLSPELEELLRQNCAVYELPGIRKDLGGNLFDEVVGILGGPLL